MEGPRIDNIRDVPIGQADKGSLLDMERIGYHRPLEQEAALLLSRILYCVKRQ